MEIQQLRTTSVACAVAHQLSAVNNEADGAESEEDELMAEASEAAPMTESSGWTSESSCSDGGGILKGNPTEKLLRKLLDRLPRGGFRLTDLGVIHDENVICKIP